MQIVPHQTLPDVKIITPDVHRDNRGSFAETYRLNRIKEFIGLDLPHGHFVQANHSASNPYTLRGMHFQLDRPQGKLVTCISGTIFDVAVDLRNGSPTYGQWMGHHLDDMIQESMWIPPGFAHGILALGRGAVVTYQCSESYDAKSDKTLRWDDPRVGIRWPIPSGAITTMSAKDRNGKSLADLENDVEVFFVDKNGNLG